MDNDKFPAKAYPLSTSSFVYVVRLKVTKLSNYYEVTKYSMIMIY
jgi:hypothetical protein